MFIQENHMVQFRYIMYIQDSINSLIALVHLQTEIEKPLQLKMMFMYW